MSNNSDDAKMVFLRNLEEIVNINFQNNDDFFKAAAKKSKPECCDDKSKKDEKVEEVEAVNTEEKSDEPESFEEDTEDKKGKESKKGKKTLPPNHPFLRRHKKMKTAGYPTITDMSLHEIIHNTDFQRGVASVIHENYNKLTAPITKIAAAKISLERR